MIGLPPPLATVLSIGDVLLYAGVVVFCVVVMRGRFAGNRRPPAWIPMYRGSTCRSSVGSPSGSLGISACSSELGNRTVIVAPSFGALCTSNEPPPTWARSRIIAMPKCPSGPGASGSKPTPLSRSSEHDGLVLLAHADPHVGRVRMLQRVHDALPAMWKISRRSVPAGHLLDVVVVGHSESRPTSSVNDSRASASPLAPSGDRCRSLISARMRSEVSCLDSRILSS